MYFLLNNLLAIASAWCVGQLAFPNQDPVRRLLTALLAFAAIVVSALQLLGSVGQLSNVPLTALLAAFTICLLSLAIRSGVLGPSGRGTSAFGVLAGAAESRVDPAHLTALAVFAGVIGAAAARSCFAGTDFSFDDLLYHGPSMAHWVRDGYFSETPWNPTAYYPKNTELLSFWFVLPFGSDAYASLAGFYWLVLLAVTVLYVARRLDIAPSASLVSAALCVGAFKTIGRGISFTGVDVAAYAALLAAVAFAIPAAGPSVPVLSRRDAFLSGVAAGLSAGAKLFAVPGVILLFAWWCVATRGQTTRLRFESIMLFAVSAAALGSFWYVRSVVLTGNPIYPADIGPFAGLPGFGEHRRLLDAVVAHPTDPLIYFSVAKSLAAVGLTPVLVAVAGYFAAAMRVTKHVLSGDSTAPGAYLIFALGSLYALIYPIMPSSGFYYEDGFRVTLRYVAALVVPAGIMLFFWALGQRQSFQPTILAIGILAIVTSWRGGVADAAMAVIFGISTLLAACRSTMLTKAKLGLAHPPIALAITSIFLAVLVAWFPYKQHLTDRNLYGFGESVARVWGFIDQNLPADSRITWYGPVAFIYYPLFGRDYRLEPRRARNDGNLSLPFFKEAQQIPLLDKYQDRLAVDPRNFVRNLRFHEVNYVLVTRFDKPELTETWQPQLEALRASDEAYVIYDDGESWLWHLKDPDD